MRLDTVGGAGPPAQAGSGLPASASSALESSALGSSADSAWALPRLRRHRPWTVAALQETIALAAVRRIEGDQRGPTRTHPVAPDVSAASPGAETTRGHLGEAAPSSPIRRTCRAARLRRQVDQLRRSAQAEEAQDHQHDHHCAYEPNDAVHVTLHVVGRHGNARRRCQFRWRCAFSAGVGGWWAQGEGKAGVGEAGGARALSRGPRAKPAERTLPPRADGTVAAPPLFSSTCGGARGRGRRVRRCSSTLPISGATTS